MLDFTKGKGVSLEPISLLCWVNGVVISQSTKLNQGKVCLVRVSSSFHLLTTNVIRPLFIAGKSNTDGGGLNQSELPARKNLVRSAGKRVTGAKRGKTCNRCPARENV